MSADLIGVPSERDKFGCCDDCECACLLVVLKLIALIVIALKAIRVYCKSFYYLQIHLSYIFYLQQPVYCNI
jgi:hypothetical protein